MPEGLEAEIYRRAADRCVGRTIATVRVDDRQAMADELRAVLPGRTIVGTGRRGKLVLVALADGPDDPRDDPRMLGLHFGMTGRLIVDGEAAIDRLEYASGRDDPAWDRFVVEFTDGTTMRVNDPRRWAVFSLDPSLDHLGPDVLELDADVLRPRLSGRRAAIKTVLLDQSVVAGYGNMCVDEVLFHAGTCPLTPTDQLTDDAVDAIAAATAEHLPAMLARGGSHAGVIDPEVRAELPPCPRDGAPLRRDTVGGRTTVWCPVHQRR